ncbi:outer membrane transport energization protein TonB [Dyella jiangningensis]|uniref:energy transducer TonB n=1 Tax=Dyella sp. AtDHG13 TaxID=1938897 RepID=UPI000884D5F3|nr:TonB C-terminal domain-containing protein [Dyella sp. AtDHG13]PXV60287.1 outer membrane transport energization protein TonB [Dyella sp. AtDHG13]SDJ39357.1 outer membrane transport energization protein TonB [Dyella jiangningensis]
MNAPAPSNGGWKRWRGRLVVAAVAIAAGLLLWHFAGHQVGVRRSAPRIATITPLPPPPPPPKEKPPEPKKVEETKQDVPKPNEPMKPVEAPKQAPDLAKQVTINGPAQAGNDSFNIGAGDGGGMVGSGGGNGVGGASYEQYLGYALQQAIERDDRTRRLAFDVKASLWIEPDGRVSRVELVTPSGSSNTDQALISVLQGLRIDTPPPSTLHMPVRAAIRGRRPA